MGEVAVWFFGGLLLAQQGQARAAAQEHQQLVAQRAAAVRALRAIQAEESVFGCGECVEGLHAHSILVLVDRGLGTKHACRVPKEWLQR